MDDRERIEQEWAERGEQVVGGILPDQEDAGGNFAQTDSAGGPGDRPVIGRERAAPDPAGTASGGYGAGSGFGGAGETSSGGSEGGGENLASGSATEFMRGEAPNDLTPDPAEPRGAGRGAAGGAIPSDVEGE